MNIRDIFATVFSEPIGRGDTMYFLAQMSVALESLFKRTSSNLNANGCEATFQSLRDANVMFTVKIEPCENSGGGNKSEHR